MAAGGIGRGGEGGERGVVFLNLNYIVSVYEVYGARVIDEVSADYEI